MNWLGWSRLRWTAGCVLCLAVAAACSVATPRNELYAGPGSAEDGSLAFEESEGAVAGRGGGSGAVSSAGDSQSADGTAAPGVAAGKSGSGSRRIGSGTGVGSGGGTATPGPGSPGSKSGTVGVTDTSITVSFMLPLTSSYGALFKASYESGTLVWRDDVNARNGIHGRQVKVITVDMKDTSDTGKEACKQVLGNGTYLPVLASGLQGGDVSAAECLDDAGLPTLALSFSTLSPSWRNVYVTATRTEEYQPLASFIKNVLGEPTGRIGTFYLDDPSGVAAKDAFRTEVARLGMQVVHEEPVKAGQSSFVPQLQKMRDEDARTVALIVATESVGILRDAQAIGYKPQWTGAGIFPSDEVSQAAPALFAGIKALRVYSTTDTPAYADYVAKANKYRPGSVTTTRSMAWYGFGLLVEEVLRKAGPTPTRASLAAGIQSIANFNNGINWRLTWSPGTYVPRSAHYPVQCCNPDNTWKAIGEPKERF